MPHLVRLRPAVHARCAAYAAACALSAGAALWSDGNAAILAGAVLVALVCAPLVVRLRHDPLDPPGIYVTLSAFCYGVMSLSWLGATPPVAAPGVAQADVKSSLILVACGLAAFAVGARVVAGPVRPRPRLSGGDAQPVPVILGLFGIGVLGVIIGLRLGAVGFRSNTDVSAAVLPYAQIFQQLSLVGAVAAGALALSAFRRPSRRLTWLLVALVAVQVMGGFVSGYKQQALLPVLLVGVAYVSCHARVPWKAVAVGAAVAVFGLLPATIVYRVVVRPPSADTSVNVRTPGGLVHKTADYLEVRFRLIDSVAIIQARTPSMYPFANGRRYTLLPALVTLPRVVWPDKPILNDGLEFSHSYWEIPPNITTATPLTQAGDLYRNFGWPGVVIGMAIWGLAAGGLARLNAERRSPRLELVALVALVQIVPFIDNDLPQLIAATSRTLMIAGVIAWLALPGPTGPPGFARVVAALSRSAPAVRGAGPRQPGPDPEP